MLNLFRSNPTVEIEVKGNPEIESMITNSYNKFDYPFLSGTDSVKGTLSVAPPLKKVVSHRGIVLELFGDIRAPSGESVNRFFTRKQFIQPAGDLAVPLKQEFAFENVSFPTSTYFGGLYNIVYGLELRVSYLVSDFVVEQRIGVVIIQREPKLVPQHKEIGIQGLLHVEFVFPKGYYGFDEQVVGAAYFILVKLRIVFMSVSLYRNEEYAAQTGAQSNRTILKTFELMDGPPVKGESIPIRIFMGGLSIWPFIQFPGSLLKVEHYLRVRMEADGGKVYYKRLPLVFGRYRGEPGEAPE